MLIPAGILVAATEAPPKLHVPAAHNLARFLPSSLLRGVVYSYATQRYRTEWFGIILHSLESVWLVVLLLMLVLK